MKHLNSQVLSRHNNRNSSLVTCVRCVYALYFIIYRLETGRLKAWLKVGEHHRQSKLDPKYCISNIITRYAATVTHYEDNTQ